VTSVNKVVVTAPATASTLTIADGATLALTGSSATIAGSGSAVITMPTSNSTLATLDLVETITGTKTFSTNVLVGAATAETGSTSTVAISNGTAPDNPVANEIIVYSVDSSDATATLGIFVEQSVEDIGTFTPSHKLKIKINGTEYWIQLDAV
jgi:hypothetical protein